MVEACTRLAQSLPTPRGHKPESLKPPNLAKIIVMTRHFEEEKRESDALTFFKLMGNCYGVCLTDTFLTFLVIWGNVEFVLFGKTQVGIRVVTLTHRAMWAKRVSVDHTCGLTSRACQE